MTVDEYQQAIDQEAQRILTMVGRDPELLARFAATSRVDALRMMNGTCHEGHQIHVPGLNREIGVDR